MFSLLLFLPLHHNILATASKARHNLTNMASFINSFKDTNDDYEPLLPLYDEKATPPIISENVDDPFFASLNLLPKETLIRGLFRAKKDEEVADNGVGILVLIMIFMSLKLYFRAPVPCQSKPGSTLQTANEIPDLLSQDSASQLSTKRDVTLALLKKMVC